MQDCAAMERAYGLEIPQTLEEVCDPRRLALVVYDMQAGVLNQIERAAEVTERIVEVLRSTVIDDRLLRKQIVY